MDDLLTIERKRFLAALAVFLLWTSALAAMAVFSGYKPIQDAAPANAH